MAEILIVDDSDDISLPLSLLMISEGHGVRVARNGLEGLAALSERFPDLIILDVEMPHLSGPGMAYDMLIIDSGREGIPIVLLSGATDLIQIAKIVGTPYQMEKPFKFNRLCSLVGKALSEKTPITPSLDLLASMRATLAH